MEDNSFQIRALMDIVLFSNVSPSSNHHIHGMWADTKIKETCQIQWWHVFQHLWPIYTAHAFSFRFFHTCVSWNGCAISTYNILEIKETINLIWFNNWRSSGTKVTIVSPYHFGLKNKAQELVHHSCTESIFHSATGSGWCCRTVGLDKAWQSTS